MYFVLSRLRPSATAPSPYQEGSLLTKPKDSTLLLTSSAENTSSFTYMSSTYADVAFFISLFCSNTVLTITFIIRGATLRPNPRHVRQYLLSLTMTVWKGHSVSWTRIWRYAFCKSSKAKLAFCCRYSFIRSSHTPALAVEASTYWFISL